MTEVEKNLANFFQEKFFCRFFSKKRQKTNRKQCLRFAKKKL